MSRVNKKVDRQTTTTARANGSNGDGLMPDVVNRFAAVGGD